MRLECRECFPCHRLERNLLVSDPGMHHGTCVTHVPWCMSGSLTRGGWENVPGIPGACATRNFTYLAGAHHCRWHQGFCSWKCTPTYRGYDSFYGCQGAFVEHYNHRFPRKYIAVPLYFLVSNSHLYPVSVTAVMYSIACRIRQRYNYTWLLLL